MGDNPDRERLRRLEAEIARLRAERDGTEWLANAYVRERDELARARAGLQSAEAEIAAFRSRRSIRYLEQARRGVERYRRRFVWGASSAERGPVAGRISGPEESHQDLRYDLWLQAFDTLSDSTRRSIQARLDKLNSRPLVSIVMPVYETPEAYLREAIESVRAQIYENWQLCISDDASKASWIRPLLEEYGAQDARVKVVFQETNGHIAANSNAALGLATGEWVALFDHDDILPEHALAMCVLAIEEQGEGDLVYTDEDHIDDTGTRSLPYFKPDYDPVLICGQNYLSHLCLIRRERIVEAGGFRLGYEGSQDWDLVLRVLERTDPRRVIHVPHVLYHWRAHGGSTASSLATKPYAADAGKRAVADHFERIGVKGHLSRLGGTGYNRVGWPLPPAAPEISVIVVPRHADAFVRCVDSLRKRSTYDRLQIMVVDAASATPRLYDFFDHYPDSGEVVAVDGDVSDRELRNAAVRRSRGDVLCFIDDNLEVLNPRWAESMAGLLLQEGIGVVGGKIFFEDFTLDHAGTVVGIGGTVGNAFRNADWLDPGYFARAQLSQCYSAVAGGCMAIRREVFEEVQGFDEVNPVGIFADTDLCLRVGEAGWRVAWTPDAEFVRQGPATRGRVTDGENAIRFAREVRYMQRRWEAVMQCDPAYNPNLSLAHETFPLAWPPRVPIDEPLKRPLGAPLQP